VSGSLGDCRLKEHSLSHSAESSLTRLFADHPGVVNSHSRGSIGVLAVKKTKDGIFLYFGHNTESFVSRIGFSGAVSEIS
jgi:hypothetical protein